MKKNLKPLLLIMVVAIAAIYSGCKKDDPASNTDNLCGKDWQVKSATVFPPFDDGLGGGPVTDIYTYLFEPCDQDDYTNFSANGTFLDYDGANKCDAADPDTAGGYWSWNSNETILIKAKYGELPDSTTITKNDGTTIIGTQTFINNGITYTVTFTLKKK